MNDQPIIYIGSDHEGYQLKEQLAFMLRRLDYIVEDAGPSSPGPVDYPDYAEPVARAVSLDPEKRRGILICATGIGMCMVANRFEGVLAGQVWNLEMAKRSREDDDINILCLAAAYLSNEAAEEITKVWLNTNFSGLERHVRRLTKIGQILK